MLNYWHLIVMQGNERLSLDVEYKGVHANDTLNMRRDTTPTADNWHTARKKYHSFDAMQASFHITLQTIRV